MAGLGLGRERVRMNENEQIEERTELLETGPCLQTGRKVEQVRGRESLRTGRGSGAKE